MGFSRWSSKEAENAITGLIVLPFKTAIATGPGNVAPPCAARSPWRSLHKELAKAGGSHAAPLRRPGTCRRHLKWVPGRGTGQLAVQADNRDRSPSAPAAIPIASLEFIQRGYPRASASSS